MHTDYFALKLKRLHMVIKTSMKKLYYIMYYALKYLQNFSK